MTEAAQLALSHALTVCRTHAAALQQAIEDWRACGDDTTPPALLGKDQLRILDQFAYRYIRLQDDMGMRLFPSVLRVLGEEVTSMPMIDRLNRLEQLGWIDSAEGWMEHRRIRNEFTHEYPEADHERRERIRLALSSAQSVLELFGRMSSRAALMPLPRQG